MLTGDWRGGALIRPQYQVRDRAFPCEVPIEMPVPCVVGRQAGIVEGFRYKKSIVEAGEGGLVWDAASITEYLQDPTAFLKKTLDDNGARSGMAFKVRSEEEAADLAAFLATFSSEGTPPMLR